jgi:lipopolysaccharide assembly protein B
VDEPSPPEVPRNHAPSRQEFLQGLQGLIEEYSARVQKDRNATEDYVFLGRLLRLRGDPRRALKLHQRLLARPDLGRRLEAMLHTELGLDLLASRSKDFGEKSFQKALALEKHNMAALQGLAEAYEWRDDFEAAVKIRTRLVRLGRGDKSRLAFLYAEYAADLLRKGNKVRARRIVEEALRADPKNPYAQITLADVYIEAERYEKAIQTLRDFLRQWPTHSFLALRRLEDAHYRNQTFPLYESTLREILRDNPENFYVHFSLARHLRKKKRDEEAREFLRRAVEIQPAYVNVVREWTHLLAGDEESSRLRPILSQFFTAFKRSRRFICPDCRRRYVPVTWRCTECGFRGLFHIRYELPAP